MKGAPIQTNEAVAATAVRADRMAALWGIVPGLGHVYKGHYAMAALILLVDVAVVFIIGTVHCLLYASGAFLQRLGIPTESMAMVDIHPLMLLPLALGPLGFWLFTILDAIEEDDLRPEEHHRKKP